MPKTASSTLKTTFTSLTGDYRIDSLLGNQEWGTGFGTGVTLIYSFHNSASTCDPQAKYIDNAPYNNPAILSETTKTAIRLALSEWTKVANVSFVEVTDTGASAGILRFRSNDSANFTGANGGLAVSA